MSLMQITLVVNTDNALRDRPLLGSFMDRARSLGLEVKRCSVGAPCPHCSPTTEELLNRLGAIVDFGGDVEDSPRE